MKTLRLGLIGGNITESRSPALQIVCGLSVGLNVSYDLLIPREQDISFEALLQRCQQAGFDGVNVTYPYKEEVLKFIPAGNAVIAELGASNTIRFAPAGPKAWNTDYTGFISAYRAKWGQIKPGRVMMIGTGGVGRAIAFGLKELGADEILLHDIDTTKAEALALAVGGTIANAASLSTLENIDGVINCTPLGMSGRAGSPLQVNVTGKPRWAFDAVYTPEHTTFRAQTEKLGAEFLSGYELYFNQGIQGFKIFSELDVTDHDWVRRILKHRT
jgi:shikimate dehydrogenase